MANDSASGGYLLPTDTVIDDQALQDLLQGAVVGITGLPGPMVRPRWQTDPPPLPAVGADWAAIGAISFDTEGNAYIEHLDEEDSGLGTDELTNWEAFDVIVSFYGPNAQRSAGRFRDGIQVPQNREALWTNGNIVYVDARGPENLPDLRNDQWVQRYDIRARFRRAVSRTYTVRNLVEASGTIQADTGTTENFAVTVQP